MLNSTKRQLFFCLSLLTACASLSAQESMGFREAEPCCLLSEEPSNFQFQAELLYFKPTVDQSSYVITSTDNRFGGEVFPNGRRHLLSSTYRPGFRLEGLYDLCDGKNALDFRFTYFKSGFSKSTSGDFLFDTIGYPGHGAQAPEDTTYAGTAHIHHHYSYYGGDATLNQNTFCCDSGSYTFLAGLHYAYIGFKQKFNSTGTFINGSTPSAINNHFTQNSSFWGIGPQAGMKYDYFLPECCLGSFGLNMRASGALLCSCTNANLQYISERTGSVGVNLKNDELWRVTPTFNARLGLSYYLSCFSLVTNIELGYEFLWYSNCIDKITSYDVALGGDSIDVFDNLSMQGPFLAIKINF